MSPLRDAIGTALGRPRRWRYLERMPKGGVAAEIGVFRGEFTPHIVRVTAPRELHLIDGWWTLYGERYPDWGAYTDYGTLGTRDAYEEAKRRTEGMPVQFHVGDDLELLAGFPDAHFDWVYLDTTHEYEQTLAELEVLRHKVRSVIAGDDWKEDPADPHHGLSAAVQDFCGRHGWRMGPIDAFAQWSILRD
jgi:hypothetical protein